ncbi:glycosyltransferase family 2 protein [uncultured Desulfovibrio sp.]|uniref:glycosyltransferase family 2 protein n=1 Tax=uncultured Desulfovibrio sp. TaxID=167968 RepID=UPI0026168442|nr:glycosyltransferase family 2 protein [uncultured Desulfovibrio sp.]
MFTPQVSIALRTYNQENHIAKTVKSVLNQTFQDWELIIVDDNSPDGTIDELKKFQDDRIKIYKNEKNLGVIGNLNKVLSYCQGEYISILDGDDIYKKEKLDRQVNFLNSNQDYGAVFSFIDIKYNPQNKKSTDAFHYLNSRINKPCGSRAAMLKDFFFHDNYLAFPTEMFRRQYLLEFPENLIALGDCNFHIKMLLQTKIKVLEEYLVEYDISDIDSHVSSWTCHDANKIEELFVMDNFLLIDDINLFKEIFFNEYEKYGELTKENIPYLLIRIALNSQKNFWARYALSRLFSDNKNFTKIMNTNNLSYNDYIALKNSPYHIIRRKNILGIPISKKVYSSKVTYYIWDFPVFTRNI